MEEEKNTSSEVTDEDRIHGVMRAWIAEHEQGEVIMEDGCWVAAYSKKEKRIYLYKVVLCSIDQNEWVEAEHRTMEARHLAERKIFDAVIAWANNHNFDNDPNPAIINCLVTINTIADERPVRAMMAVRVNWQFEKELSTHKDTIKDGGESDEPKKTRRTRRQS